MRYILIFSILAFTVIACHGPSQNMTDSTKTEKEPDSVDVKTWSMDAKINALTATSSSEIKDVVLSQDKYLGQINISHKNNQTTLRNFTVDAVTYKSKYDFQPFSTHVSKQPSGDQFVSFTSNGFDVQIDPEDGHYESFVITSPDIILSTKSGLEIRVDDSIDAVAGIYEEEYQNAITDIQGDSPNRSMLLPSGPFIGKASDYFIYIDFDVQTNKIVEMGSWIEI